jgi:hypothetical protein
MPENVKDRMAAPEVEAVGWTSAELEKRKAGNDQFLELILARARNWSGDEFLK